MFKRTHTCGALSSKNINESVNLNGWIHSVRFHGQIIFIDLRDRYGKTQLVFDPEYFTREYETVKKLSIEDVISVSGKVNPRAAGAVNPKMKTGEIEVIVSDLVILNETQPLPFMITDRESASEEHRLKYRYLELRTEELQKNLIIRHKTYQVVRNYLSEHDFVEVETPVLMKSTPEGARDYLVPSRLHPGKFYALPQSPQTYKQLLMVSGMDRYFQIVKCFRDEDLRADRQPEFTQIDIEMSFIDEENIFSTCEGLMNDVFSKVACVSLPRRFPRMTYAETMERYGSDKPDLRFGLELKDFKTYSDVSDFKAFSESERVMALVFKGGAKFSRKNIDELTDLVKKYGAKGLAWIKMTDGALNGGISKFFSSGLQEKIITSLSVENNDIIFIIGDRQNIVQTSLGALRAHLGRTEGLVDKSRFCPLWVVNFPMFEYDDKDDRFVAMHHPFTAPDSEGMEKLDKDPGLVNSRGYDLVMNGYEIAGGSIRIHEEMIQKKVFKLLGIDDDEAREKFGFLIDSFKYGAPPHGGIAFGFDRLIMLLAGTENIRDVIAFPKTTAALSLMDGSPSNVSSDQLEELGLSILKKK